MESNINDEAQLLRSIDDSDGVDIIVARVDAGGVVLTRVEVASDTGVNVAHLGLDAEEMDKLAIWWRNRRLREQAQGGYAGAP